MKKNNFILLSYVFISIFVIIFLYNMETDNFYIHLPSNVLPTSPQEVGNTISNYVTRLNRKLNLSEDWEVGLTDISYTKSWYNIMKDQNIYLVDNMQSVIQMDNKVPAGNYENVDEIINSINNIYIDYFENIFDKEDYPPNLIYNKQSNKITIKLGKIKQFVIFPTFSKFLARLLGLTDSQDRQYPYVENFKPIKIMDFKVKLNSSQKNKQNTNITPATTTISSISTITSSSVNKITENNTPKTPVTSTITSTSSKTNVTPTTAKISSITNTTPSTNLKNTNKNTPKISITPTTTTASSITDTSNTPTQSSALQNSETKIHLSPQIKFQIDEHNKRQAAYRESSAKAHASFDKSKMTPELEKQIKDFNEYMEAMKKIDQITSSSTQNSNISKRSIEDGASSYDTNSFNTRLYVEGFKEVSLHGTIQSLYVYCNIIKPVLVGNYEVPLIRRVEIPNNKKFGDTVEIIYPQPQYYPLVSYEFDNIEIDIKDDTDNSLDFAFGRTAVTLHFRKKQNNVLKSLYELLR